MLTTLANLLARNTRFGHWLSVKLNLDAVHRMFCPCCPEWDDWAADGDL